MKKKKEKTYKEVKSIHLEKGMHHLLEKRGFQYGKRIQPALEQILGYVLQDKKLLGKIFAK